MLGAVDFGVADDGERTGHDNRCLTSAPVFKISMVGFLGWLSGITCFWA
jgi:hypothetical protein